MSFYSEMAATAARLIKQYGAPVAISRTTGRTIDPVTGQITSAGTTEVLSPNGIPLMFKDNMIDGTRIKSSDRLLVLDSSVEPLTTDKFNVGGQYWSAVEINSVAPAGLALVHFVQVRR